MLLLLLGSATCQLTSVDPASIRKVAILHHSNPYRPAGSSALGLPRVQDRLMHLDTDDSGWSKPVILLRCVPECLSESFTSEITFLKHWLLCLVRHCHPPLLAGLNTWDVLLFWSWEVHHCVRHLYAILFPVRLQISLCGWFAFYCNMQKLVRSWGWLRLSGIIPSEVNQKENLSED